MTTAERARGEGAGAAPEPDERPRYTAGIVHYDTEPGLGRCLASLKAQSHAPMRIVVVHQGDRPDDVDRLRSAHPDVDWTFAENRGYAGGANRILAHAAECASPPAFTLILNPDVELGPTYAETLLGEMAVRPDVALGSGKLLRPCGERIDSAGIERKRSRRFVDRGSEALDDGRYDRIERVFAVSGAAMMLRRSLLRRLSVDDEVFDEDFFVYHEDTDLAWRARRMGLASLYVPAAHAIHVRGWRRGRRHRIPEPIRRHSFKNRYLELIKNERPLDLLRDLPFILPVEVARLGFALLVDPALLGAYADAARHAPGAWRKRRRLRERDAQRGSVVSGDDGSAVPTRENGELIA
jgi:GT2 family glycosyltransferase